MLKTAKTRESRLNAILFGLVRSLNAFRGSPKLFLTAQGVGRGGAPRKSAAAQHFAMRQIALPPHDVRYAMWARHCTKNGADSTVGMPRAPRTTSSARKAGNHCTAAAAVEVDAGRIESFEGAPARNHGPGDRRGFIFDANDDDADDNDVDLEL